MFIKSAASYTDQGKAIQSINERWGGESCGTRRPWEGRETIGIQVCKKKYSPFLFTIETLDDDENDVKNCNGTRSKGEKKQFVKVVRLFGCPHHSNIRKEKITCHGVRKGWEPFGQWSLRKAQELARKETIRLNGSENNRNKKGNNGDKKVAALSNSGKDSSSSESESFADDIKTICHNGKCLWKKRGKYDNVYSEITGYSESSSEEDA